MITNVDAFVSSTSVKRRRKRKLKLSKVRLSPRRVVRRAKKR